VRERPRQPRLLRKDFQRLRDKWRHRQEEQAKQPSEPRGHQWAPPPPPGVIVGMSVEYGQTAAHQKQLMLALQRFGHFAVFCYSALFESSRAGLLQKEALARARRRAELVPFLKVLAAAALSKVTVVTAVANAALGGAIASTVTTSAAVSAVVTARVEMDDSGRRLEELQRRLQGFPMHPEEAAFQGEKVTHADAAAVLSTLELSEEETEETQVEDLGRSVVSGRLTVGGRSIKAPNGEVVTFRRRTFIRGVLAKEEKKKRLRGALSGRYSENGDGRDRSSDQRRLGVSKMDVQLGAKRDQAATGVTRTDALLVKSSLPSVDSLLERNIVGGVDQLPILAPLVESRCGSGAGLESFSAAERDVELVESVNAPPQRREDMQWEAAKLKAMTSFDDESGNTGQSPVNRAENRTGGGSEKVGAHPDGRENQSEGEGETVLGSAPFGHLTSMPLGSSFVGWLERIGKDVRTHMQWLRLTVSSESNVPFRTDLHRKVGIAFSERPPFLTACAKP
jgi:hypothetical protein